MIENQHILDKIVDLKTLNDIKFTSRAQKEIYRRAFTSPLAAFTSCYSEIKITKKGLTEEIDASLHFHWFSEDLPQEWRWNALFFKDNIGVSRLGSAWIHAAQKESEWLLAGVSQDSIKNLALELIAAPALIDFQAGALTLRFDYTTQKMPIVVNDNA